VVPKKTLGSECAHPFRVDARNANAAEANQTEVNANSVISLDHEKHKSFDSRKGFSNYSGIAMLVDNKLNS
jgi:hypothetical protein